MSLDTFALSRSYPTFQTFNQIQRIHFLCTPEWILLHHNRSQRRMLWIHSIYKYRYIWKYFVFVSTFLFVIVFPWQVILQRPCVVVRLSSSTYSGILVASKKRCYGTELEKRKTMHRYGKEKNGCIIEIQIGFVRIVFLRWKMGSPLFDFPVVLYTWSAISARFML